MSFTSVLGKRKRAQASYVEPDITEFDEDANSPNVTQGENEDSDEDTTYGSRRNTRKSIVKGKKRARLNASKLKKEEKQNPFPFLSLPPELRDYIYELALTEDDGIALVSTTKSSRRTVRRGEINNKLNRYQRGVYTGGKEAVPVCQNSLVPNLLAVNKQIHAESVGWLYRQPFYLEDTMALYIFLAAIGPARRRVVTDITVEGWGGGRGTHKAMNLAALTSMAECTNIETFHLDCDVAWFRRPKDLARQLYRDGHFFFERLGMVKGKKDAILDVLELSDSNFDRRGYYGWGATNAVPDLKECKEGFRAEMSKLLGA